MYTTLQCLDPSTETIFTDMKKKKEVCVVFHVEGACENISSEMINCANETSYRFGTFFRTYPSGGRCLSVTKMTQIDT